MQLDLSNLDLSNPGQLTLALGPEIFLTIWSMVLLTVCAWRHRSEDDQRLVGWLAFVGFGVTLLIVLAMWLLRVGTLGLGGMVAVDEFRFASDAIFLLGSLIAVALSLGYNAREKILIPEYYPLLTFATIGMMFMGGGSDLIVIFLGLELMSIAAYVLAGINRRSAFAVEAALKYFLLGAFASGFLVYGIALIYGATGTTNLSLIRFQVESLQLGSNPMLILGVGMLLIGFGFKVAAVPFHMWAPDVYDGSPTPVTTYMATAVKAAAFAALVRITVHALGASVDVWRDIVWWLAAITMIGGNLLALAQRHLKRMLAYSSIGHAGYILVAVASGTHVGASAFLFYIFIYTLMTAGAFAILIATGRKGEREVLIDSFAGLASQRPWMALAMSVFMLSLLGFPGTAGFIGKWYIISGAVQEGLYSLAVVLVVGSVISAGYYLPVIMAMYMKPADSETAHSASVVAGGVRWVVTVATVLLLLFGVWPNRVLSVASDGARNFAPQEAVAVLPAEHE